MEFSSATKYIESATCKVDMINKIQQIIDALLLVALKAAATDNITEYNLDDGQVKIKTSYNGAESVYKSINAYRRLKQEYLNELNGRVFRLVDSKSFHGRRY